MPADVFAFGPFELDTASRQLTRQGAVLQVSPRQFDLLHLLVARAGTLLSKDALIEAAWQGVAVTDNSVEQAISSLRRLLAEAGDSAYIETQARRGYRFVASVTRVERRAAEEDLEALLAPHRAFLEGRAALETLERTQIVHAREVFQQPLPLGQLLAPPSAKPHYESFGEERVAAGIYTDVVRWSHVSAICNALAKHYGL